YKLDEGLTVPWQVTVADVNNDGMPDIVTANSQTVDFLGASVYVLLNNGDGTFHYAWGIPSFLPTGFVFGSALSPVVREVDGDCNPDLVFADPYSNKVDVLKGNGDGTFTYHPDAFDAGSKPYAVAVADLDGDGTPDIAVADSGASTVSVL